MYSRFNIDPTSLSQNLLQCLKHWGFFPNLLQFIVGVFLFLRRPVSFFDEPWFYFLKIHHCLFWMTLNNWLIESTESSLPSSAMGFSTDLSTHFQISISTDYKQNLLMWFFYWIFHVLFYTINDKNLMNCLQALSQRPVNITILWVCSS